MQETHRLITENPVVIALGATFSSAALREFFHAFRAGMIYAAAMYEESIPDDILFCRAPHYQGFEFDKLVYRGSDDGTIDEIVMSHAYIASYCMAIEHGTLGRFSDHFPEGLCANAITGTICHGVEESYHRHQVRELGKKGVVNIGEREHPLEEDIYPVIALAIERLSLRMYPLYALAIERLSLRMYPL
ncbi:MAG: hypothetical protein EXS60_00285 [Candidatus Pacebacteria bacterium]|nr:hypothetical protein [Candidatus Paceibacterota bacterium]